VNAGEIVFRSASGAMLPAVVPTARLERANGWLAGGATLAEQMVGRVGSTNLFIAAGGNCVGALLAGGVAAGFGITAPYWAGFAVAVLVSVTTWRVFSRATMAAAYATAPAHAEPATPAPVS